MEKLEYSIAVKDMRVLRHGDDFATLATRAHMAEFKKHLSTHILVKHIATWGLRPQLLDSCEGRSLNRVLRWAVPPFGKAPERIEIKADPRHAELLIKNSGLQPNSKGVNTPGERPRDRQFAHSQTFTARYHAVPFQCHETCVSAN